MTDPNTLAKQAWEIACGAYEDATSERDDLSKREMVLAGDAAATAAIAAVYAPRLAELEKLVIALHAALAAHTCYGCPACPGDCSGACHPMIFCPTEQAKAAFFMFDRTALGASHD